MVAMVAAGCSGGGGKAPDTQRAALMTAVRAYSDAYLGDRPTQAHDLLSSRCAERISLDQMTALTKGAQALYGAAKMTSLDVVTIAGSLARVTYAYDNPAINQTAQPWVSEGGAWHYDGC